MRFDGFDYLWHGVLGHHKFGRNLRKLARIHAAHLPTI